MIKIEYLNFINRETEWNIIKIINWEKHYNTIVQAKQTNFCLNKRRYCLTQHFFYAILIMQHKHKISLTFWNAIENLCCDWILVKHVYYLELLLSNYLYIWYTKKELDRCSNTFVKLKVLQSVVFMKENKEIYWIIRITFYLIINLILKLWR